jgi:hypothetical protein
LLKPHIIRDRRLWQCCIDGEPYCVGYGDTPLDAWIEWNAAKSVQVALDLIQATVRH